MAPSFVEALSRGPCAEGVCERARFGSSSSPGLSPRSPPARRAAVAQPASSAPMSVRTMRGFSVGYVEPYCDTMALSTSAACTRREYDLGDRDVDPSVAVSRMERTNGRSWCSCSEERRPFSTMPC